MKSIVNNNISAIRQGTKKILKCVIPSRCILLIKEVRFRFNRLRGPAPYQSFSSYDQYWEQRQFRGIVKVEPRWRIALRELPSFNSLLDIGCGDGGFLAFLNQYHPTAILEGIDISNRALELAHNKDIVARLHDVSRESLPIKYDVITCFEALEHMADAESALKNISHSFSRRLIISIPNIGYIGCRLRLALFGRFPLTRCIFHINEHLRHWTPKDFVELLEYENLMVTKILGCFGPSWLPWRRFPRIFSEQIIYVIEHKG